MYFYRLKKTIKIWHRHNTSRVIRDPVFVGSNQDRHKPGCTATVLRFLEMDLGSREIVLCNQKARVKLPRN